MYCFTDYKQYYTVYSTAQISITEYRTTLLIIIKVITEPVSENFLCAVTAVCQQKKYLLTFWAPSISGSLDFVHPR